MIYEATQDDEWVDILYYLTWYPYPRIGGNEDAGDPAPSLGFRLGQRLSARCRRGRPIPRTYLDTLRRPARLRAMASLERPGK